MAGSEYPLNVYVPRPGGVTTIDPGSGIVGTPSSEWFAGTAGAGGNDTGRIVVDYEGRRFNQANIVTFADKCLVAAGRHLSHYPTIARAWMRDDELVQVGEFDGNHVFVTDPVALAAWLGYKGPAVPMAAELSTSTHTPVR